MFRSLHIDGYRAFSRFSMEGLKQINLLVGGNNSGKTSVLEALYLLTAAGDIQAIWQIVSQRGERLDIDTPVRSSREDEVDISHLFHGHELRQGVAFSISSKNKEPDRFIKFEVREASQQEIRDDSQGELYLPDGGETMVLGSVLVLTGNPDPLLPVIKLSRRGGLSLLLAERMRRRDQRELTPVQYVPTESLSVSTLMEKWKNILLTEAETLVLHALRFLEPGIERIAAIPSLSYYRGAPTRGGFLVRLRGYDRPIPIGSLGDGSWRMLALAIALIQAKDGVLLIDEIDTGLHYTVMSDMWRLVFNTANDLNIQVFATTHSYDCVKSLATICDSAENSDGHVSIQRIEPEKGRAVHYSDAEIRVAAEQHIEVR